MIVCGLSLLAESRTLAVSRTRFKECEKTTCQGSDGDDPNCVLRCVSESCWQSTYPIPLEPGEIDFPKRRLFDSCVQKEEQLASRQQSLARSEARKGKKASGPANDASDTQDSDVAPDPSGVSSFV